jgi:hypothetical protein
MRIHVAAAVAAMALVAACQPPAPEPVSVEPVYTGKYGTVETGVCREEGQAVSARFPGNLPLCSNYCAPGTSYVAGTNAVGQPVCVPTGSTDNPDRNGQTGGQTISRP